MLAYSELRRFHPLPSDQTPDTQGRALGRNTDQHTLRVAGGLLVGSNDDPDTVVVAERLGARPAVAL